ncbi:MAG: hypothetical protein LC105_00420 [Chitinophagales bacterium]|nr:hypothetical protein [Chitinophagales bacterium]MCZ2392309.1 hypothetical protein [Chitinophagales bacterium]
MKKIFLFILSLTMWNSSILLACDVCQEKQPDILKGITHGVGPQGDTDYIIIWSAIFIVLATLYLSVKYLVNPKETAPDHIKNIVVE